MGGEWVGGEAGKRGGDELLADKPGFPLKRRSSHREKMY